MPRDTPRMMESAMRVTVITAGLVLGVAFVSTLGLATQPAKANQTRVTCLCDCPQDQKLRPRHAAVRRAVASHKTRPVMRRLSRGVYYNYRAAAPIYQGQWHGPWRVVPNDASIPAPAPVATAYYPPPVYVEPPGLTIDQRGWSGGVGNEEPGGGGGGGTGQVLLTTGANSQNGPTYNSYGESFQQNSSVAEPFQNRLMGGLAPTSSSSNTK